VIKNERPVTPEELVGEAKKLFDTGHRFVTATCLDMGENFEILYHFDKDLADQHFRLTFTKETEIPSITGVYLAAFLIENEMKELFGAKIAGIAVDYGGTLLTPADTLQTPMLKSVKVTSVAAESNGGVQ
jgi:ech hydrogenase subunit D